MSSYKGYLVLEKGGVQSKNLAIGKEVECKMRINNRGSL